MPQFTKARSKLARALEQIEHLERGMDTFLSSNTAEMFSELSPDKKEKIWRFRLRNVDISHLSNEVDDIVGNLRNPLDIAIADIAFTNAGRRDRAYFPFGKDENAFLIQLKEKTKDLPDAVRSVLKTFGAYPEGSGKLLWWLHLLNIDAKHRGLHLTGLSGSTTLSNLGIKKGEPYILGDRNGQHMVMDNYKPVIWPFAMREGEIEFLTTSPDAVFISDFQPAFGITFNGMPEVSANDALRSLHELVSQHLDQLDSVV